MIEGAGDKNDVREKGAEAGKRQGNNPNDDPSDQNPAEVGLKLPGPELPHTIDSGEAGIVPEGGQVQYADVQRRHRQHRGADQHRGGQDATLRLGHQTGEQAGRVLLRGAEAQVRGGQQEVLHPHDQGGHQLQPDHQASLRYYS